MIMLYADVDCETGPWLGWSNCFGECDFAMKLNYRRIVVSNRIFLNTNCTFVLGLHNILYHNYLLHLCRDIFSFIINKKDVCMYDVCVVLV